VIKPPQRAHVGSRANNDDDDARADIDASGAGDERRDAAPETCANKHPRARPLLLCALALHLALTLYALPLSRVLGPLPLGAPEILGLYQQTLALVEAGRVTSVYDPTLLAGVTTGTPGALATPLYTLGVQLLPTLGLAASAAFNLVTLLIVLTGPLFVWRAAHVLTQRAAARAITLLLAVLVWHLDSSARLSWAYSDDPTFALGAALSVLALATLTRDRLPTWAPAGLLGVIVAVALFPGQPSWRPLDTRETIRAIRASMPAGQQPLAIGGYPVPPGQPRRQNTHRDWVHFYTGSVPRVLSWDQTRAQTPEFGNGAFMTESRGHRERLTEFRLKAKYVTTEMIFAVPE
jgi:hypothetical protein